MSITLACVVEMYFSFVYFYYTHTLYTHTLYMYRVLSRNFCLGGPQVNTITTTVQSQEYTGGKLEVLGEAPPCG